MHKSILVTDVNVEYPLNDNTQHITMAFRTGDRFDPRALLGATDLAIAPEKVIKKCKHCGQYGAIYCACSFCGAPID